MVMVLWFRLMEQFLDMDHGLWMFIDSFNYISAISCRFALLVGSSMSGVKRFTRQIYVIKATEPMLGSG